MSRGECNSQRRAVAFLNVMLLLGASVSNAGQTPESPQIHVPNQSELMDMMNRNMGKAPIKEAAATDDGVQVVFQTGHASQITAVAISADGRYMLSGGMDETAKFWDVASGQEVRTISGFATLGPRTLVFNHEGTHAAIGDMTGIKVYDVASGREIRRMGSLSIIAMVSGDGRVGVVNGIDGDYKGPQVVDLATGATLWAVPIDESEAAIALSADGTTLLTQRVDAEVNGDLRVWDVATRKLRRKLPGSTAKLGQITALSPDGKLLLTENFKDRSIDVVVIETGQKLLSLATDANGMQGMTTTLSFSPDGRMVAWATATEAARVWEIPSGKLIASLQASALGFSANSKKLAVGRAAGGAPLLRDIATGAETLLSGGAAGIADLALTADGRSAAAAMSHGGTKLWDLATGQVLRTFECPGGGAASSVSVSAVAVPLLATGCMDGSAWLWDLGTGRQLRNLLPARDGQQYAVVLARFSGNGQRLAIGVDQEVSLWDVASGQRLRQIALPAVETPALLAGSDAPADSPMNDPRLAAMMKALQAMALHPAGELVAVGRDHQVALFNALTGELVRVLSGSGAAPAMPSGSQDQAAALQGQILGGGGQMGGSDMAALLKKMMGGQRGQPSGVVVMNDPAEALNAMASQIEGSRSLAFSRDGRLLLMLGNHGPRIWDVTSGEEIRPPRASAGGSSFDPSSIAATMTNFMNREMGEGQGSAFSADGRLGARGLGRVIKVWNIATGAALAELVGHTSDVTSLAFTADGRALVSGGHDGAIRVWNLATRKEAAALIALGHADFVAVTPDQYYRASKSRIKGVAFRVKGQLYPFEQFDLRFNRPDILLERLGMASAELIQSYRLAYEHRLKKMGFTEAMLGTDFHLPEIAVLTPEVAVATEAATMSLRVRAHDDQFTLDRLNVFVNDVPLYGSAGLPVTDKQAHAVEQSIEVPLVPGRNKIQVSVLNQQGTESLRQTVYTNEVGTIAPADTFVLAIGVSQYKNSRYNLRYAAKDANDLSAIFESSEERTGEHGKVHVLRLTNDKATRTQIKQAKEWLAQAKANDLVVVFAAGHGMTDSKSNYYFGTYDIDPQSPEANGLPYAEFEALLDGIPALQKVLLLDTCFSGEIDKDDQVVVAQADTGGGTVTMRAFKSMRGVTVVADSSREPSGLSGDMLRFQQDWFADLRRGTGAAVISSSSGNEYSLEGEQWNNGVFTYSLLQGLKNAEADANKDHIITVSELQGYVIDEVRKLTHGGQNPTARRENLEYDFAVYR